MPHYQTYSLKPSARSGLDLIQGFAGAPTNYRRAGNLEAYRDGSGRGAGYGTQAKSWPAFGNEGRRDLSDLDVYYSRHQGATGSRRIANRSTKDDHGGMTTERLGRRVYPRNDGLPADGKYTARGRVTDVDGIRTGIRYYRSDADAGQASARGHDGLHVSYSHHVTAGRSPRGGPSIGADEYYLRQIGEILDDGAPPTLKSSPSQIVDYIYLGSCWDAQGVAHLQRLRVNHVLNCAATRIRGSCSPYDPDAGVAHYMAVAADDTPSYDMLQHVDRTNAFIAGARQRGGRVLVHCVMGINRSGFVVAAYLIGVLRMTLLGAVRLLKEKRGAVLYNVGFRRQLVWYARKKGLL